MPVHMACLSGYSDCVENIIPRGIYVGGVYMYVWEKGTIQSGLSIKKTKSIILPLPPLPFSLPLLLPLSGHRLASEVDDEDRTCLHAAACGG